MLSLLKLVWFVITILVMVKIWSDKAVDTPVKLLWTLVILFLPYLGIILWFWIGRKQTVRI